MPSLRAAALGLAALLAACDHPPPTTHFQVDLCGDRQAWTRTPKYWESLFMAQLQGYQGLTLSFRMPRAPAQEASPDDRTLQFHLVAEPGVLHPDRLGALVRRYALQADAAGLDRERAPTGTGSATLFDDPHGQWPGGAGELQVTGAKVLRTDGDGDAYAVASGRFRVQVQPPDGRPACTVEGSFRDASFILYR